MGNAGKVEERARARVLRAQAWTLAEIAEELGVSKGSVSVWVRDVDFVPKPRHRGHASQRPHPLHVKKLAEIERCRVEAQEFIGELSERDLEMFCLALYAGEGAKADGAIKFANTNAALVRIFATWLRQAFVIDETRLRMVLYLHADLDLASATSFWSRSIGVPVEQFSKPYRAVVGGPTRSNRHEHGCATLVYNCRLTHRRVMARIATVTSTIAFRDSSAGRASDC
jgi:transcriptional regulator with XRE-family HTH domain